jgi:hypothetical protein
MNEWSPATPKDYVTTICAGVQPLWGAQVNRGPASSTIRELFFRIANEAGVKNLTQAKDSSLTA